MGELKKKKKTMINERIFMEVGIGPLNRQGLLCYELQITTLLI